LAESTIGGRFSCHFCDRPKDFKDHLVRTLLELLWSSCGSPLELYDDGIITFLPQILYFIESEPHTPLVFYWRDNHVFSLCCGLGKKYKKSFKTIYSKFHLAYSLCYVCAYTSQFRRQVGVARLTLCYYSPLHQRMSLVDAGCCDNRSCLVA